MKTTLLAAAIAATGALALPAIGHAQDAHDGMFINGNIGQASLDEGPFDDDDTGFGANIGYRWAVSPSALIGIEGGYTDLGSYSATVLDPGGAVGRAKADITGWNIGANGHFNFTPNWYVSGRAGWFRADLESGLAFDVPPDAVDPGLGYRADDSDNGWYAGAGFGYDFSSNASIGLNYDFYRADATGFKAEPSMVSVSGEVRF
jgi:OOP family OmpA-OmpF porin/outer membrane immunogenic protein